MDAGWEIDLMRDLSSETHTLSAQSPWTPAAVDADVDADVDGSWDLEKSRTSCTKPILWRFKVHPQES